MDTKDQVKAGIDTAADRAKQATDRVADAAQRSGATGAGGMSGGGMGAGGQQAADQASGVLGSVTDAAKNVAATVGDYASQARDAVQGYASTAADQATHAQQAAMHWASDAATATGDTFTDAGESVTSLIRRYPIPALLVGVGIGVLLAQLTTMSNSRRY